MFSQCFPALPHGTHCFQRQFCFQEAKFASATRQKHFVFPRGMEAWQHGKTRTETIMETCFLVLPGLKSYSHFLPCPLPCPLCLLYHHRPCLRPGRLSNRKGRKFARSRNLFMLCVTLELCLLKVFFFSI